jgi:hypothetical protein
VKARLAASAALALGIAIGGSGCAMLTYQATTEKYDASDGVSADVGALDVRNVLVVSDDGAEGNLVLSVTNTGSDDETLSVQLVDAGDTHSGTNKVGQWTAPGPTTFRRRSDRRADQTI